MEKELTHLGYRFVWSPWPKGIHSYRVPWTDINYRHGPIPIKEITVLLRKILKYHAHGPVAAVYYADIQRLGTSTYSTANVYGDT